MTNGHATHGPRTMSLGAGSEGSFVRLRPNPGFTLGGVHWCAFGGWQDRKRADKLRRRLEAAGWQRKGDRWYAPTERGDPHSTVR